MNGIYKHRFLFIVRRISNQHRLIQTNFSRLLFNSETGKATRPQDNSPTRYCIETVKKYDYENFLCTLLIEDALVRRAAFATPAFNVEIAQIRDVTSTPQIGEMRFQFWLDTVDNVYNKSHFSFERQPVAYELKSVIHSSQEKLSKHWFKKLIETRKATVNSSDFPFNTVEDLQKYCEDTNSVVYYLLNGVALRVNNQDSNRSVNQIQLDHVAYHIGIAQGLSNILRGIPFNARNKRCYVPNDLLVKHKLSHQQILRGDQSQSLKDVCYDIASLAHQNLHKAKELQKPFDPQIRLLFLPIVPIEKFLVNLQKVDFNVFDVKLTGRHGFLPLLLWFEKKKIKFRR